jgi:hypothetical protein
MPLQVMAGPTTETGSSVDLSGTTVRLAAPTWERGGIARLARPAPTFYSATRYSPFSVLYFIAVIALLSRNAFQA